MTDRDEGTESASTRDENQRRDLLEGLDQLVQFLREHPAVPFDAFKGPINVSVGTKETLVHVGRLLGYAEKVAEGDFFSLRRRFGPITVDWFVYRQLVCRKVVTGTRAIPAERASTADVYEWVCDDPLFAPEVET